MKKITLFLLGLCLTGLLDGQTNNHQELIRLGKAYNDFMFRKEPTKEELKELRLHLPEDLRTAGNFILETITTRNKLLTLPFLQKPDNQVLRQVYVIAALSSNMGKENPANHDTLIDSLMNREIPVFELVDTYYELLFISVGNKNKPFDLSKVDFKLADYGLTDDTEKGIFVLRCMDVCGKEIWGYINIAKPINTKAAYAMIKKYPKFNGHPYYQYTDFYFADFEMVITSDQGPQSYKSYYLDKLYEVLLSHLICLNKEGGSQDAVQDLLLGSIMKESNLYKYTKFKEVLEDIFKRQK